MTDDEKDSISRSLNEAGIAKDLLLKGGKDKEILRHLDAALSWCKPLLGFDHPMFSDTSPSLQYSLQPHEDMNH